MDMVVDLVVACSLLALVLVFWVVAGLVCWVWGIVFMCRLLLFCLMFVVALSFEFCG